MITQRAPAAPAEGSTKDKTRTYRRQMLEVALPEPDRSMAQDAEWCVVRIGDQWNRFRFHDYEEIFAVPGLYERVIYDILRCQSPAVVTNLLMQAVDNMGERRRDLRVLDLGAGNGMVGELLVKSGAGFLVGVDIIEEAAAATERDRPHVYDHYHVLDFCELAQDRQRMLADYRLNALTCVAALGFSDIPTKAFATAYNLVEPNGWVAFNIKEDFVDRRDSSGFARLIQRMTHEGIFEVCREYRYVHRLGTDREPIHYVAYVATKRRDLSPTLD